jgi:hypothetical protein
MTGKRPNIFDADLPANSARKTSGADASAGRETSDPARRK